jgi:hypothetical protein
VSRGWTFSAWRHQAHDRGLADRLAAGDRQRHVLVGAVGEMALHEGAAVDLLHRLKHARIGHALLAQLEQELHLARGVVVPGHSSAALRSSSRSWAVRSARIGVTEM